MGEKTSMEDSKKNDWKTWNTIIKKSVESIGGKEQASKEQAFVTNLGILAQTELDSDNTIKSVDAKNNTIPEGGVQQAIAEIIQFVRDSKSANPAVYDMFGFAPKRKDSEESFQDANTFVENWENYLKALSKKSRKEYLYFIADMKIKATVYLLRIYNFTTNFEKATELQPSEKIKNLIIAYCEKCTNNEEALKALKAPKEKIAQEPKKSDNSETNIGYLKILVNPKDDNWMAAAREIFNLVNAYLEENAKSNRSANIDELLHSLFSQYFDSLGREEKERNSDVRYYLFDNSMKEILFTGIGWNWMWRYEPGRADLFRCSNGKDEISYSGDLKKTGRDYYQQMIQNIVWHMNSGSSVKLASYSKNPFRDIYKYMTWKVSNQGEYCFVITERNDKYIAKLQFGTDGLLPIDNSTLTFHMVKKAKTNQIWTIESGGGIDDRKMSPKNENKDENKDVKWYHLCDTNPKSFSEFIIAPESDASKEHIFCVDILNNAAAYSGDVRKAFNEYKKQFPDLESESGLQYCIVASSDQEVVMLGNTCDEIILLNEEKAKDLNQYDDFAENTEYRLTLSGRDIVQLFSYIHTKYIHTKYKSPEDSINLEVKYSDNNDEKYKIVVNKIVMNNISCILPMNPDKEDTKNEDDGSPEDMKNKVEKAIKKCIEEVCTPKDNWKIGLIGAFLDRHKSNFLDFGEHVYIEDSGDPFINLCRHLYLK